MEKHSYPGPLRETEIHQLIAALRSIALSYPVTDEGSVLADIASSALKDLNIPKEAPLRIFTREEPDPGLVQWGSERV